MTFRCVLLADQYRFPTSHIPPMTKLTRRICINPENDPKLPAIRPVADRFIVGFDSTFSTDLSPAVSPSTISGAL